MENKMNTKSLKTGLLALGYVTNLKTCRAELNALLKEEDQVSTVELNTLVEKATIIYLNKYGYAQNRAGESVARKDAAYLFFDTELTGKDGNHIVGWFEKKGNDTVFRGVTWGTKQSLDAKIRKGRMFHWGDLYFKNEEEALAFLEDLAVSTIPETWSFRNKPSTVNHPILKSYIENTFEVLKKETERGAKNKLIYSRDGKYLLFNSNLLDKFFSDIYIIVEVCQQNDGSVLLLSPKRVKNKLGLCKIGFAKNVKPEQPRFFDKVEEVIFQPTWAIDYDFDKFTHIIEERRLRFPVEMQAASSDELGRKLKDAIVFAVAIAQRNYKFIVPMYRPQTGKIQLLMPIYLKGTYSSKPDFALILTPDKENEFYTPETILPLDAVYQNARLIAKPDDTWLNPDTIL